MVSGINERNKAFNANRLKMREIEYKMYYEAQRGGILIKQSTGFGYKYWMECAKRGGSTDIIYVDYNKGLSDEFLSYFIYDHTNHMNRIYYKFENLKL